MKSILKPIGHVALFYLVKKAKIVSEHLETHYAKITLNKTARCLKGK